jgi:hypothetical protein
MVSSRLRNVLLIALGAASLAACDEGYGYGYGGMSAGYGPPGRYCDPYWEDCYGAYGYGYGYYGDPWWGWYGDYYYPGIGFFVYDRFGHRHRWNDSQRRFWEGRRGAFPNRNWNDQRFQNWGGFRQGNGGNRGVNRSGGGGAPHMSGTGHRGH